MSEEKFVIIGEEYVGYRQGNAYIISNGECKFSLWERKEDAQKVCNYLNEQQVTIKQLESDKAIAEDYANIFEKENVKLRKECKEKLDTFDKAEIEAINIIYEEKGFDGVIEHSRQKLYDYGVVKEKNGLVMMATGGWSDNEYYLYCLNHLFSNFGRNHYVGYLRGGAFYYSKDKYNVRTEIVVIDDD